MQESNKSQRAEEARERMLEKLRAAHQRQATENARLQSKLDRMQAREQQNAMKIKQRKALRIARAQAAKNAQNGIKRRQRTRAVAWSQPA